MTATKIATCCYCGTRAALTLAGKTRHELACSACGAPLHELKALRADRKATPVRGGLFQPPPGHAEGWPEPPRPKKPKGKARKKRKSKSRRLIAKTFDLIEDIFD